MVRPCIDVGYFNSGMKPEVKKHMVRYRHVTDQHVQILYALSSLRAPQDGHTIISYIFERFQFLNNLVHNLIFWLCTEKN